jgi:hypothetical protein
VVGLDLQATTGTLRITVVGLMKDTSILPKVLGLSRLKPSVKCSRTLALNSSGSEAQASGTNSVDSGLFKCGGGGTTQ